MRKRILVIIGLAVLLAGGWLAWQRWTPPTGQSGAAAVAAAMTVRLEASSDECIRAAEPTR